MPYFKSFPKILYNDSVVTDITLRTKILDTVESKVYAYESYIIRDGDRPDTVSFRYYGRSDLDWLILIANNLISIEDWPKTDQEIYNGLIEIYGSLEAIDNVNDPDAIVYYETIDGLIVDQFYQGEKFPITILQNEYRENEKKRVIRLVKKEYVNYILSQQIELMKQ
jgi:hypothetical protein